MPANVAEWDARYREAAQNAASEPAGIVSEWLPMLPRGSALDIACGTGRHALLLAGRGEAVTAIDWSATGLEVLERRARNAKFAVRRVDAEALTRPAKHRAGELLLIQTNLEEMQLPVACFSVILCVQYLQRSLFTQMSRALSPGGLLLFETFTRAQLEYSNGARNPAHLLEPGELRTAFPELHVLFYRELNAGQGIASLVGQKPLRD
jgi:tellurite methyltransferase